LLARRGVAPQGPAHRDVDLLKAAANPEHRLAGVDHPPDHRQRDLVAAFVERAFTGLLAIALRRDVRGRAGQQHPIEPRGDLGGTHQVGQRGDDQRGDIGMGHRRTDVALHHHLRRFDPAIPRWIGAVAGDHAKDGAGGAHDLSA
jgi:hypothetical protein